MDGELTTALTPDGPCARKERALLRMLTSHMLATSSGQATPTVVSLLVIRKMGKCQYYSKMHSLISLSLFVSTSTANAVFVRVFCRALDPDFRGDAAV